MMYRFKKVFLGIYILLVFFYCFNAYGGKNSDNGSASFLIHKPPHTPIDYSRDLSYGLKFEIESSFEKNFNLDSSDKENIVLHEIKPGAALGYHITDNFSFHADIEPVRKLYDDDRNKKKDRSEINILQFYAEFDNVADHGNIKLGRLRFKDSREWLFDEEMDGIKASYQFAQATIEVAAFEKRYKDLIHGGDDENVDNYMIYGHYQYDDDHQLAAWYWQKDDHSGAENEPEFLGFRASGEFKHIDYWGELVFVDGEDGDKKIDAWGYDARVVYWFKDQIPFIPRSMKPRMILGYTFAQGDNDLSDNKDGNFRQTGYQDNDSKDGSISRHRLYGEMTDMELSNIQITAIGFGLHPVNYFSLDLMYFDYRQHKAADFIRDSEIDADPTGKDRDIGNELDLIIGYRHSRKFKLNLVLGYFRPGNAFIEDDSAYYTELKVKYFF